jgi:acetylornithine deacetylase/succinyl-diaminopimelate desuccinylase-like protein
LNRVVTLDAAAASHVDHSWDADIVPVLHDYIRIPNVSVAYDAGWDEAGHMARATDLLRDWCQRHVDEHLEGATVEVQHIDGRTPLLLVDVPPVGGGPADDTVLLYGHLDKQPPFSGWREGLGPWDPVVDGDRLYGRGGADDGYSTFAAVTALEAVRAAGGAHSRCVVLVEASEESGSPDTSTSSATASASRRWWWRSTRGAATGTACGSPPRCGA